MLIARQTLAVTRRILIEQLNARRSLVFWAVFPTLMLLLFGLIYSGRGGSQSGSFDATAPGILIGAALFFSCLSGPVMLLVTEREHGTLRRLLLSPLSPLAYFLGVVLAFACIGLMQALIVYGIAAIFGGRFHGNLALGALILALSIVSYVGLGFFFGTRFARRTQDVNGPVSAFGVPMLVLGGTFFPVSLLPDYLLMVAHFNPVLHMNRALGQVSANAAGLTDIGWNLAYLAVFALLSLGMGVRAYGQLLQIERGKR